MRFPALASLTLILASCSVTPPSPAPDAARPSPTPANRTPAAPPPSRTEITPAAPSRSPQSSATSPRVAKTTANGITLTGVSFDSRTHRLALVDQPDGPGSLFRDAAAAARSRNALASVNGGFFTPEGKPLGLAVANGTPSGTWNATSSLGSAIWRENRSGKSSISRRNAIGKAAAIASREALQTGPLLVENGKPVPGLSNRKSAVRTLLLWDGSTRWWIGRASSCTLRSLANALAAGPAPAGWPVKHALNLDGGLSSDLWISGNVPGGPLTIRPLWNRPVRNFLVLLPR